MRKRKVLWLWTVTVLAVVLVGTGCARGPLSVLFPKREKEPVVQVSRPPSRPPIVERPTEIVERRVAPPAEEPPGRGIVWDPTDLSPIHFEFDKSRITEEARVILQGNAERIKQNPDVMIQIEGHCDERGTNEYNLALGLRRARSTREYLINLGVDPSKLTTISYGEEQPVDPRHNEEAWALNRRAQFGAAEQ